MLPTAFAKTLHEVENARSTGALLRLGTGLLALGGLGYWAVFVPVSIYETTADARVELDTAPSVLQAPMTGRVVQVNLTMGQKVKKDDLLVQLDAVSEELQASVEQTRASAVQPEIRALERQIQAEISAGETERRASVAAVEEADTKVREAEAPLAHARRERDRAEQMLKGRVGTEQDFQRAAVEVVRIEGAISTAKAAIKRIESEQRTRNLERETRIAEIRTSIAKLEGERVNAGATLRRAAYDAARRVIRAPVDGEIGEASILKPGAVVTEGARIATIVPLTENLHIVANFPPKAVIGRIHVDRPAKLRLKGFPWTEYGAVDASVSKVAAEDRDGQTRVELALKGKTPERIPLRHGMPGELEVLVESIPPYQLVLRTAGQWLTAATSGAAVR